MKNTQHHQDIIIANVAKLYVPMEKLPEFVKNPITFKVTECLGDEAYSDACNQNSPMNVANDKDVVEIKNSLSNLDPFFVSKVAHYYKEFGGKAVCYVDVSKFPFITCHVNVKDPKDYSHADFDEKFSKELLDAFKVSVDHPNALVMIIVNTFTQTATLKLTNTNIPHLYEI